MEIHIRIFLSYFCGVLAEKPVHSIHLPSRFQKQEQCGWECWAERPMTLLPGLIPCSSRYHAIRLESTSRECQVMTDSLFSELIYTMAGASGLTLAILANCTPGVKTAFASIKYIKVLGTHNNVSFVYLLKFIFGLIRLSLLCCVEHIHRLPAV